MHDLSLFRPCQDHILAAPGTACAARHAQTQQLWQVHGRPTAGLSKDENVSCVTDDWAAQGTAVRFTRGHRWRLPVPVAAALRYLRRACGQCACASNCSVTATSGH